MGYKMKGINSFGEGTPLLQKKTVAGEGTGLVKKDDKGNKYAIYGGRNADLEEYDSGYEDGVNPWTGDPSAMPGNTPAAIHSGWKPGDDDFIMGGEHSIDETKSSKNRKKGPKSYKTTD